MAIGTANHASSPTVSQHERFIEQQLNKTRVQVKLVDLFGALMTLAVGVLAFLLAVAIVDSWVFALGFWGRLLVLAALCGGSVYYLSMHLVPLLVRHINPAYAARMIEQSQPSLKNSLINFWMFHANRASVHDVVYQALEQKAADDLSHVPIDSAVDRSKLIRIGYVLATVLAVCGLYKILSPKDPFQTLSRVLAPWAEIARPARVQIEEVKPGSATVFHGQTVEVSAKVRGVSSGDTVTLYFTTEDKQTVRQPVAMHLAKDAVEYKCTLPPEAGGIRQSLAYRIEAGDASTADFFLTVLPAPTIVVQSVEYDYPDYTERPNLVVERQGDVRSLEGTRVTIRARANQPIQSAYIEFDPAPAASVLSTSNGDSPTNGSRIETVNMQASGQDAQGHFLLELQADRKTPKHSSYQIRFITEQGPKNEQPIVHQIEVIRDLSPEVEILAPKQDRIELPEDGRQMIEVRAVDPDYALSKVALRAVKGGTDLFDQPLLNDSAPRRGQAIVGYEFKPTALGLVAGDEVTYWAVAEDNRTSAASGRPEPNAERTRNYHIKIIAAEKSAADEPKEPAAGEQPKPQPDGAQPNPPKNDGAQQPGEKPNEGAQPQQGGEKGQPQPNEGNAGNQQPQGTDNKDQSGNQQSGNQASQGDKPGNQQSGNQQPGQGNAADQQQNGSGQGANANDSGQPGEGQPGQGQPGQGQPGQGQPGQGQPGQGQPGQGQPGQGQPSDGQSGAGETGQRQPGGNNQTGGQPGQGTGAQEPLHDGEVFERALEHRQQQQDQSTGQGQAAGPNNQGAQPGEPRPGSDPSSGQQGAPNQGARPGENQQTGTAGQPDKQPGKGQPENSAGGSGGEPKGGAETRPEASGAGDASDQQKQPGQGDNGQAGSGQDSKDKTGTAASQAANADRDKTPMPNNGAAQNAADAQSPSNSKHQSDSQGGASGDKSGGGEKGPGQGAKQPGQDSAGSSSVADQGSGAAPQPGTGDTSGKPGDKQTAPGQTGNSGSQPGNGTDSKADPAGNRVGSQSGTPNGTPGGSIPGGGELTPDRSPAQPDAQPALSEEEKANLDYARKATDLALEYLKDQKDSPDAKLLEKLGMSKEELQRFIDRWQQLKQQAARDDTNARHEVDESLRSLGLRPTRDTRRSVGATNDTPGGIRDTGLRSEPPQSYLEQFNAFKKGTSRATGDK
jgi:hypothetical protein